MQNFENTGQSKVLVIGATVIDVIMELNQLPKSGEDVWALQREKTIGGCGYNVAAVLKFFQVPMDFLTPVGNGANGKLILSALEEISSTGHVFEPYRDNGWDLALVENSGERTFITIGGAETHWKKEWFDEIRFLDYTHIYVSGYEMEGASGEVILSVLKEQVTTQTLIFDPGPRLPYIDLTVWQEMLNFNLILTVNADEANFLSESQDGKQQAREIFSQIQSPVIIRKGEQGVVGFDGERFFHVPAVPVKVVDTIGAGDAHTGALICAISRGDSLQESIQFANRVASQVVGQAGGKFCGFDRK